MLSLIAAMSEACFRRPELNVVVVGLDNAGKTAVVDRLKLAFGPSRKVGKLDTKPTMGMNFAKLDIAGCRVTFWDLGGSKKLRGLWERYYADAHGWIFVLDSADRERLAEARDEFLKQQPNDLPCLVLLNKADLTDCLSVEELRRSFELSDDENHIVRSASAATIDGIADAVKALIDRSKLHIDDNPLPACTPRLGGARAAAGSPIKERLSDVH